MTVPLTTRERLALGQSHRRQMTRTGHAGWQPKLRRADPLKLLAESMRGRVPALIRIKYDRMAVSPFGFFRGAVPVMAYDLSLGPNTGIHTQLCGDAHVRNLGAFAAPDGRLVFDINDFDETISGPFEWDVKRMATSLILAGHDAGAKNSLCVQSALAFLANYRAAIHFFSRMPVLELARYQVHRLHNVRPISQILAVAERATPLHNLDALTVPLGQSVSAEPATSELFPRTGAHPRVFRSSPPDLTGVDKDTARLVLDSLATYALSLEHERRHFLAQYTPLDIAFKIVGTGSVGLRDYCIFMQGNGAKDPLFLQIKEEVASGYAPYLGNEGEPKHQGQRVVQGQRAMQFQSDPFLGWTTIQGRDYLVRQLNDHKAGVEIGELKSAALLEYAAVCGETLARGHARAGDPCLIAGYIGTSDRFDQAIAKFAADYAAQTERDWQALVRSRRNTASPTKSAAKSAGKSETKPTATPSAKAAGKSAATSAAEPSGKAAGKAAGKSTAEPSPPESSAAKRTKPAPHKPAKPSSAKKSRKRRRPSR